MHMFVGAGLVLLGLGLLFKDLKSNSIYGPFLGAAFIFIGLVVLLLP